MLLFTTARTDVYLLTADLAPAWQTFLLENRMHLAPFEPLRSDDYFTLDSITQRITASQADVAARTALPLVFTRQGSTQIIGSAHFSNMMYGVFQACYLGFALAASVQGEGLMTEVLRAAINHVQREYGLHRIMANHLPDNLRSRDTLQRLGFVREGYAASYLKINGTWRDHVLNALVLPEA